MRKTLTVLVALLALALAASPLSATTIPIYVKAGAPGTNTGDSWDNAFTLLESALAAASSGSEIWVAAGTYMPTNDHGLVAGGGEVQARLRHFEMKDGVAIYGGFAGSETLRSQRNWTTHVTVLSGNIGDSGDNGDNCYRVFYHVGLTLGASAVLDGFTITAANANSGLNNGGAGMYNVSCSPAIRNCLFSNNAAVDGGGMYNISSSPTLTNCAFSGNSASNIGGGMLNASSSPAVTNCTFSGNSAGSHGGGMYNENHSSPVILNCTFSGNSAESFGGGMVNDYYASPSITNCTFSGNPAQNGGGMNNSDHSSPAITNCTFRGNSAESHGGGMYNSNASSPAVTNCILWGDSAPASAEVFNSTSAPTFGYCDIAGCGGSGAGWNASIGLDGGGNTAVDPLFVNAASGDYHLLEDSPCIDAANGTAAPARDQEGKARRDDPGMPNLGIGPPWADIGVLEFEAVVKATYVKVDATGENDGTSWTDAFTLLQSALNKRGPGDEIWVAAGTYKPTSDYGLGIGDRGMHFEMINGVGIYGGFAGTETFRGQRDWTTNVTILSGDIGESGDSKDNCCHVFYHSGLDLDATAVLDGFTITAGNATGAGDWPHNAGGGMHNDHSSPTVTDCVFTGNAAGEYVGGGIANEYASPVLTHCTFSGNSAGYVGGGIYNDYSSPTVTNCTFSGNSAGSAGGAMTNLYCSPTLTNCTFNGNSSSGDSGAIYNNLSSPSFMNCTFSGNAAPYHGGGVLNYWHSSPTFTNCLLWGNGALADADVCNWDYTCAPTFSRSDIAGCGGSGTGWNYAIGTDDGGNIDADPKFVSPVSASSAPTTAGDYHLTAGSPCIDSADGKAAPATDIEDNLRHDDPGMPNVGGGPPWADVGAYEFQGVTDTCPLSVHSTPITGVAIASSTNHNGSTNYQKTVNRGASVSLTAPATKSVGATDYHFLQWTGAPAGTVVSDGGRTLTFSIQEDITVTAEYAIDTWTLTVQSTPITGVAITGDKPGSTNYTASCDDEQEVTLTAPVETGGKHFRCWQTEAAVLLSRTPTLTVVASASRTVVAVYGNMRLLTPSDSGIRFEGGQTCSIGWTSNLPKGAKVKVELVKGSGGTWTLSAGASKSPLNWTVGKAIKGAAMYADGSDYRIRVSTLDGSTSDESDHDFSIGTVQSLTVDGPATVRGGITVGHFTCAAHYNFGEDRDVSGEVTWSCTKLKGVKMGKTGLLTTAPVTTAQPCTITATYGKGKPPMTGSLGITINP